MVKDDVGDTDHYCLCMLEFECMSNEYATRDNEARKKKKTTSGILETDFSSCVLKS
jgi:hypothetical protein